MTHRYSDDDFGEYVAAHCRVHGYSAEYTAFWMNHQRCEVAGCGLWSAAPHHWRTRGAGGDDNPLNLAALCTTHHTEVHTVGVKEFGERHPEMAPKIAAALERARVTA